MTRISRSLTAKLTIEVLLLAILIYAITAGALFLQSRYMIRQEAKERANSVLNTALQQVRNHMNMVETATNSSIWMVEENFTPGKMMEMAQRIVRLNRNTSGCTIATKPYTFAGYGKEYSVFARMDGDSVISMREPDYDYFSEEWYKLPVDSGRACWVDLYREDTKGMIDIDRSMAIYSRPMIVQDSIAGVMSTGLSFREMSEIIYSVDYPYPNAYFVILGGDGRYLLHPDTSRLFKKTAFTDQKLGENPEVIALGYEMTAGNEGVTHLNINGKYCHVCYRPISGTDWSLALICPTGDVLKNYNRMTVFVVIFDILGVLLLLLLCRFVVRRALSPIRKLLGVSKKISEGKYDLTIPQTNREDAVGQLQNSFYTMQQSINEHIGEIRATSTQIRQHNKELADATQMAEEALRRKTIFEQNVMHQIRTPLNIIQGFAQLLRDHELSKEEFVEIASTMKYNAQHLSRMVLMLYDSSETGTINEFKLQRTDQVPCNMVARECIDYTTEYFPNISVAFSTEVDDSTMILTNHLYLMRTIRELLYNSAKYSDGKHIRISVSETEKTVVFTVEDKGPGLPHGEQDMVFEFFTKQDDLSEGLGLGLPLTKRHAINLGGSLKYDNDYKEGCRFVITMPK